MDMRYLWWATLLAFGTVGSQASNTTIDARTSLSLIPLHLARRIHTQGLPDLLAGVQGVNRHPLFTTFISEGNTSSSSSTEPPLLLGASKPSTPHHSGVKDLREVDAERRAVIRDAVCKPRKQPVPVPRPEDPLVLYTPPCVMLPRCSGCCSHELLQCVPTKITTVRKKVLALRFSSENQVTLADEDASVKRIRMQKHVKCECQCRVHASDCTARQRYDAANCRCVCPNGIEAASCPGTKIWSSDDCACKCAEVAECSTGFQFDPVQCRCLPSPRAGSGATLLFRAGAPSPPPPSSRPSEGTHGGWGAGFSSGIIVDPPAPRPTSNQRRYAAQQPVREPALSRDSSSTQLSAYDRELQRRRDWQHRQRMDQQRMEQQRVEQQRVEQQRMEQQRIEQQRMEQQRMEQQRREQQRYPAAPSRYRQR